MEPNNQLDLLIKQEVLRERVKQILDDPSPSWWQSVSRHPLTAIVVGFLFTVVLAQIIKHHQDLRDKANEQREHKYEMEAEAMRQKHVNGVEAIDLFSDIIYNRLTRAQMLGSALGRNTTLAELELRKEKFDEAFVKWNVQRNKTYLIFQDIDLRIYPNIKNYDEKLGTHYSKLDQYLVDGYDARKNHKVWKANPAFVAGETREIQRLSEMMLATIWITVRPKHTEVIE